VAARPLRRGAGAREAAPRDLSNPRLSILSTAGRTRQSGAMRHQLERLGHKVTLEPLAEAA
jgi:hypothetical protein